jgi:hypothetical protein
VATRQPDKRRALCSAWHIVGTERIGSDVVPPCATFAKDPAMALT